MKTLERIDQRTRESIERMDERAKAVGIEMARAIAPLAEVTASIKTEVKASKRKSDESGSNLG